MTRPVPVPDERSAAFWQATAEHRLSAARCSSCGELTMPPDITCPRCSSSDPRFEFVPVSGNGRVRSWTVARQSFLPGFDEELPFVLVDVELVEQDELRLIGRLVDGLGAVERGLHVGAEVSAAFEDIAPGVSIPAFQLVAGTTDETEAHP
jgi:uncharacterized protein